MTMSVLNIAARRILPIALVLAPVLATNAASAQGGSPAAYGDHQSPIDIIDALVRFDPNAPKFGDTSELGKAVTFTLKNTIGSHWCDTCAGFVDQRWGSLKAYPASAPRILFGGFRYTLKEFHFHAPAEHLVNGKLTEMEVHFVFKKDLAPDCGPDGYLVIGERIMKGQPNPELEKIFGPLVPLPTSYSSPPATVNNFIIGNVLNGLPDSYRYAGSLTAPAELGCSYPPGNPNQQLASGYLPEVVSWVVLKETIQMSEQQIARFQALFPNGDARGPQTLRQEVRKTFNGN